MAEHLYDNHHDEAPHPFYDDLFLGLRLAFNDVHGTQLLACSIRDARLRLEDHWVLDVEIRAFTHFDEEDSKYGVHDDDYVNFTLSRYF